MKANNKCRTQRRFDASINNFNSTDVIPKQTKDLIVAAAAQLLMGQNQSVSAIANNGLTPGQHCNNCSIAEAIIRATQQIPV